MSEYCFKIKFNEPFISNEKELDTFHVHLLTDENSIELRLCYNPHDTRFKHSFFNWLKQINWSNIGCYFEVSDINDFDTIDLDFSQSNVIGSQTGSNQYINSESYISITIDWIRFIRKANKKTSNTAEFYLNDNGFKLVSEYYSLLWQNSDSNFSYSRVNYVSDSHQIGGVIFNPEFNFYSKDSRSKDVSEIHKEPKFQFSFPSEMTENEVMATFILISLASSFYYRKSIDFVMARIYLSNNMIVIRKKTLDISDKTEKMTIWPVYNVHDIDKFFRRIKMVSIESEYLKRLGLIVKKFSQSNIVDVRSSILLRFAILEICKSEKKERKPEHFNFNANGIKLSKKNRNTLLSEARDLIVAKIEKSEQQDFRNKWTSSIDKIIFKPMRSPFIKYLESIGFEPDNFGVDFAKIKDIRDSITHGSIGKFSEDELMNCNWMLYRISIGLILHQLKVENWIEDLDMSISD